MQLLKQLVENFLKRSLKKFLLWTKFPRFLEESQVYFPKKSLKSFLKDTMERSMEDTPLVSRIKIWKTMLNQFQNTELGIIQGGELKPSFHMHLTIDWSTQPQSG